MKKRVLASVILGTLGIALLVGGCPFFPNRNGNDNDNDNGNQNANVNQNENANANANDNTNGNVNTNENNNLNDNGADNGLLEGQILYSVSCAGCHALGAFDPDGAPDLDGRSADVENPQHPFTPTFTQSELQNLINFIAAQ